MSPKLYYAILGIWSVVSLLIAMALTFFVYSAWGGKGLALYIAGLFVIHVLFRAKNGRWMNTDGS